jgi:hypothetical protein
LGPPFRWGGYPARQSESHSSRQEVIGLLPIARIDLALIDEAPHVDRVLRFQLQIVDLLRPDQDVVALALLLLAFLALAVLLLIAPKRKTSWNLVSPGRSLNPIGGGMRNAVTQIGPFPLVLIAFATGVLAGAGKARQSELRPIM